MDAVNRGAEAGPWVPEEAEPEGGWPRTPGAMPLVISDWERPAQGQGARPQQMTTARSVVTLKDDDWWRRERIRRFVHAWRWLRQRQVQECGFSDAECNRYLAGAGVLVPIKSVGRRAAPTGSPAYGAATGQHGRLVAHARHARHEPRHERRSTP